MSQPSPAKPTPAHHYFLKSVPVAGSVEDSKYTSRYLRYTGGGFASIVLAEAPPVFFSFHLDDAGRLLASSSKAGTEERSWGFVIAGGGGEGTRNGVVPVEIYEDQASTGFYFEDVGFGEGGGSGRDTRSILKWKSPDEQGATAIPWKGWLLQGNPPDKFMGYPQLHWKFGGPESAGNEDGEVWVDIVREDMKRE